MKYYENILETIGNTPLIKLNTLTQGIKATVLAKVEAFNPGGSIKDRIGIAMIENAEKQGLIQPGYTIIEPTSGNTGMGLALTALIKGYKMVFTIPDKMSEEKTNLLKAFGAKVIITPSVPPNTPQHYVKLAERIVREQQNTFMPSQYFNPINPETHYKTTGPEIWDHTDGKIDVLVAGIGTGGTISGTGKYLKEKNPKIRIVGVDPEGSMYHHEFYGTNGKIHPYEVEGIGEDFMPSIYDQKVIDEIITVNDKDAFLTTRKLLTEEGMFMGGTSGSAVFAALQVAKKLEKEHIVVVILPDTGRNYLNKLYSDDWMYGHGYMESTEEKIPIENILKLKQRKTKKIILMHSEDTIKTALSLMMKHDISQLPVVRDGVLIGNVNKKNLVERLYKLCLIEKMEYAELCEQSIEKIIDPPLPTINNTSKILNPFILLKDRNALIVLENGEIIDIITIIDIMNYLTKRNET